MRWLLLTVSILLFSGCGTFVTTRQKEKAAQSLSDLESASAFVQEKSATDVPPAIMWAASAMVEHAYNMARVMEIDLEDLPQPRVSKRTWSVDPEGAHTESQMHAKSDGEVITNYALYGLSIASLAVIFGKLGQVVLGSHPLGAMLGQVGHFFGGESPTKRKVFDRLLVVLDKYKEVDPDWQNNKLFKMLSDAMTTSEKEYIKSARNV